MNVDALWTQLEGPTLGADALQQLELFNSDLKRNEISKETADRAFKALAGVDGKTGDNKIKVQGAAFRTINNLVRRAIMQKMPLDGVDPALPVLVEHLSPCGFSGQSIAQHDPYSSSTRAASTLRDIYLERQQPLESILIETALNHSNSDVRCGSLMILDTLSGLSSPSKLSSAIGKLRQDPDAQVQQCARDVLKSVQIPAARVIPAAIPTIIPQKAVQKPTPTPKALNNPKSIPAGGVKAAPHPASKLAPKAVPTPASAAADLNKTKALQATPAAPATSGQRTLISEIIESPQYRIQEVKPEDVHSVHEFRVIYKSLPPLFEEKENENNWLPREKAINRLRALVRGNILEYPGDVCAMLKTLKKEVSIAALSLRTTLCTAAIQLIKDSSQLLKSYLDPLAEFYLQILSKILASQKKITATAAYIAGCSLVLNTSLSMKIMGVIHSTLGSSLQFTRECSLKWMHIMFVVHTPEIAQMVTSTNSLDMIAADLGKGLQDPKSTVREAARPVFWLFATSWPAKAEQLSQALDSQQKKALLRAQPGEMFQSYNHNFELHVASKNSSVSAPPASALARPKSSAASVGSKSSHVMHPPADKQTLTAQRHLTDIVRRLSRTLSEEKPLDLPPLEAHPVEIAPHVPEFVDAMPDEEDIHSDMDEDVPPEVVVEQVLEEVAVEAQAEAETPAPAAAAAAVPSVQDFFMSSYLKSAQEAVRELLDAETVEFDPSCFDEVNVKDSEQFKEALRRQLEKLPTVKISIEDVAAKTAQKMAPKFQEYVAQYPESKEAIENAAKLVEAAARGENPDEAMSSAVSELNKQFQDGSQTSSRINSLADLLDSDDIDTITMGVNALSYVFKGQRPPSESFPALGTLSLPPPDLVGKALTYLFEQATAQNPQIKEAIERYASSDLVAITLSYVGHALVMYVAVHMLPAEALVLTVQAIQPLLNIGTIIDTLFEIANADDVSEAALIALGGVLTGFDKIPMSPLIRDKAKAALEVIYRLGDLGTDVTAFLADWIGFDSDSDSDSDDDTDDEKIAEKHAQRFERHMAARAPASVAVAIITSTASPESTKPAKDEARVGDEQHTETADKDNSDTVDGPENSGPSENGNGDKDSAFVQEPDPAFTARPISSLHPVSVSFKPNSGTKAVRAPKFQNTSSLDMEECDQIIAEFPASEAACFTLFDDICSQLADGTIKKQGLIQLLALAHARDDKATRVWQQLPSFQERVDRSLLQYLVSSLDDVRLVLSLKLLSLLLQQGRYTDAVEQLTVLECLCAISGRHDLPVAVQYASLPGARDSLLLQQQSSDKFVDSLISIFDTSDTTGARVFALGSIRRVIELHPFMSQDLLPLARRALQDSSSAVRKEAYPILLTIHNQSEAASASVRKELNQGQLRLFEYYCDN